MTSVPTNDELLEILKYKFTVDQYGTKRFFNDKDELHMGDGPAIVSENGIQVWFQNGKVSRENNEPEIINNHGTPFWIFHTYLQFSPKTNPFWSNMAQCQFKRTDGSILYGGKLFPSVAFRRNTINSENILKDIFNGF